MRTFVSHLNQHQQRPSAPQPNEAAVQEWLFSRAKERAPGLTSTLSSPHYCLPLFLLPLSLPLSLSSPLLCSALWALSANGTGSSSQLSTPISKHSPTSTPNSPGLNNKQKVPGPLSILLLPSFLPPNALYFSLLSVAKLVHFLLFCACRISTCPYLWMMTILSANPCRLSSCSLPP